MVGFVAIITVNYPITWRARCKGKEAWSRDNGRRLHNRSCGRIWETYNSLQCSWLSPVSGISLFFWFHLFTSSFLAVSSLSCCLPLEFFLAMWHLFAAYNSFLNSLLHLVVFFSFFFVYSSPLRYSAFFLFLSLSLCCIGWLQTYGRPAPALLGWVAWSSPLEFSYYFFNWYFDIEGSPYFFTVGSHIISWKDII